MTSPSSTTAVQETSLSPAAVSPVGWATPGDRDPEWFWSAGPARRRGSTIRRLAFEPDIWYLGWYAATEIPPSDAIADHR